MSNVTRFQIGGAVELDRRLSALDRKVQRKYSRQALREGAKLMLMEAQMRAPVRTGALRKAIRIASRRARRGTIAMVVTIGAKLFVGDQFYGAFQEFGWKAGARRIGGKARQLYQKAAALRDLRKRRGFDFLKDAEHRVRAQANAEGKRTVENRKQIPGKHFLERAYNAGSKEAAEIVVNKLKTLVEGDKQ